MSPFRSLADYVSFVYTLQQSYPSVTRSTLTLARRGRTVANLTGELHFDNGYRRTRHQTQSDTRARIKLRKTQSALPDR